MHAPALASQLGLAVIAVVDMVKSLFEQLRAALRGPCNAVRELLAVGRGMTVMLGAVRLTPPSSLNGPIGPHRTWAWASASVDDVRVVRRGHGGTGHVQRCRAGLHHRWASGASAVRR